MDKIKGYRDLTPHEVALMNECKALESQLADLILRVKNHVQVSKIEASSSELTRIMEAEPDRWIAMARTDFQTGLMKLVRSIAQPRSPL